MPPTPSSSGTSLARSSSNGSSRRLRPRPRSPPSLYVAYDSPIAKPPKPLLKLDKKPKSSSSSSKAKAKGKAPPLPADPPNPFPARHTYTLPSPSPSPSASADAHLRRRPSVASSFFSLRRKTVSHPVAPPPLSSSSSSSSPVPPAAGPSRLLTRYPSQPAPAPPLHEANVHPIDDIEPVLRITSSKAARLLGGGFGGSASEDGHAHRGARGRGSPVVRSDFSGMFRIPASRRAGLEEDDDDDGEMDDGGDVGGRLDAGWHTDDVHGQRASTFLEPMAFAAPRPPSVAEPGLEEHSDGDDDDSGDGEWEGERSGITPTPPHRERLRPEAMYVPPDTAVFVRPDPDSASTYARPDSTYIRPDSSYMRPESSYLVADLHSAYTGASLHSPSSPTNYSPTSPTNHDNDFENGNNGNDFELRPDTPFLDTLVAVNSRGVLLARATAHTHAHAHTHGHGHGHTRSQSVVRAEPGEGWMGEWNQGDMQDVIHKLRVLKA